MLNPFEEFKLVRHKARIGILSIDECLELAIQAEQFKNDVGPFDIAFHHFADDAIRLEEYAYLLEKEQHAQV